MRTPGLLIGLAALGVLGCGRPGARSPGEYGDAQPSSSDAGAPDMSSRCNPGDPPRCADAATLQTCPQNGSAWMSTACPAGTTCLSGACQCALGTTVCQGQTIMQCGIDGTYQARSTCPQGTACVSGRCDDLRCADERTPTNNQFALPSAGWPRFRHDNRNSGYTRAVIADMPKLKWKVFVGGAYGGDASLAAGAVVNQNGRIFVGAGHLDGNGGSFYSYDPTGKLLYTFMANRYTGLSTPAVRADGTAYFASYDSNLYAVKSDGTQLWSYKTGAPADGDPIITREGTLIYASDDGSLYALDPGGKLLWQSDPRTGPGEVDGALAQSCDGTILAGGTAGWVALDVKDGHTIWSVPASTRATEGSPVLTADGTLFGIDFGGTAKAIDKNGNVLWSKSFGSHSPEGAVAHVGGLVLLVADDGALHALAADTGVEQWSQPVGDAHGLHGPGPVVDGNLRIYFSSTDGFVYAFDLAGHQLFRIAASGMASPGMWSGELAIADDGTLYVPGNDGWLYAFQ